MNTIVTTKYGEIRGFEDKGILKWFGIPFAKPPVGELRFKRPVDCEPWEGTLEATGFRAKPIQFMPEMPGMPPSPIPQSEDCLYLNVWGPKDALTAGKKLPVFVWIYGGANSAGEASDPNHDGQAFAEKGIVYVTITYRVGPLGFYPFHLYDKSFDSNCGVADQIAGVRWVKENIEAFGGDPDNITIAGESAGGTAVYDLLASPAAKGLFRRAIAESGLADSGAETERMYQKNLDLFLEQMHLTKDEVYKIKDMPADDLKAAAQCVIMNNTRVYPGIFVPGPVIDDLIPEKPWEALAHGSAEGVDVIFGTNHDEGIMFTQMKMFPYDWNEIDAMLEQNGYGDRKEAFRAVYGEENVDAAAANIATDRAFWVDYVRCADAQTAQGKVYAYRFDFATAMFKAMGAGAIHGSEIPYALGTPLMPEQTAGTPEGEIAAVRKYLHESWINFTKNGDPNGAHLPVAWNPYTKEERETIIFDVNCSKECNPNKERFELWEDVVLFK